MNILVIDDNATFQQIIRLMLQLAGHQVMIASDGLTGLEKLRRDPHFFDLAIVDMVMPGTNGHQVVRKLREDPELAHVKVLIMSARPQPFESDDYITKPFDADQLLAKVTTLMKKRGSH